MAGPWTVKRNSHGLVAVLPVPPSANRWWRHNRGRTHLSKEAKEYKDMVHTLLLMNGVTSPTREDVSVDIRWYREAKRGDLDKRQGILLDAMQGTVYKNDGQIVELHAYRYEDPEFPRVEIIVGER